MTVRDGILCKQEKVAEYDKVGSKKAQIGMLEVVAQVLLVNGCGGVRRLMGYLGRLTGGKHTLAPLTTLLP